GTNIADHWTGRATIDFWTDYQWTKGSYSYWKTGQYTKFSGIERARQGNCHFAGEHTSMDNQGYLEGAVETGQLACDEILGDLKHAWWRSARTPSPIRSSPAASGTWRAASQRRHSSSPALKAHGSGTP